MPGEVMGKLAVTPGEKMTACVEGAGGCYELFLWRAPYMGGKLREGLQLGAGALSTRKCVTMKRSALCHCFAFIPNA